MSFCDQICDQLRLGVCAGAVFGALLVKIVEVIVARPQNEAVQRVKCLDGAKHFVLDNRIIQLLVFVAVPFANTQPILTVAERVHPFVHDTPVQQMIDGQVHVAEVCAAPEAQPVIAVKAAE